MQRDFCAGAKAGGSRRRSGNASAKGINVLHICDSEFNVARNHAYAVCEEFVRRGLGKQLKWYAYMAVVPFDAELAAIMRKAGCVGIDFTGDSGCDAMLKAYHQRHTRQDLANAVGWCKDNGITVMIDLIFGGPGETPASVRESIDFIKQINPDCAGAPLGVRIYPGTDMAIMAAAEGPMETNPNIKRKYAGPVDLFRPTFYISHLLGPNPARLIKDFIAGDKRFFEPIDETDAALTDHNYNDNTELVDAIKTGSRGAVLAYPPQTPQLIKLPDFRGDRVFFTRFETNSVFHTGGPAYSAAVAFHFVDDGFFVRCAVRNAPNWHSFIHCLHPTHLSGSASAINSARNITGIS